MVTVSGFVAFVLLLFFQTYNALASTYYENKFPNSVDVKQSTVKAKYMHNVFLSSHGRVMRFNFDTDQWFVIHEGEGSYYGQFIDDVRPTFRLQAVHLVRCVFGQRNLALLCVRFLVQDPDFLWVISRNPKPGEVGHSPERTDKFLKVNIETGYVWIVNIEVPRKG